MTAWFDSCFRVRWAEFLAGFPIAAPFPRPWTWTTTCHFCWPKTLWWTFRPTGPSGCTIPGWTPPSPWATAPLRCASFTQWDECCSTTQRFTWKCRTTTRSNGPRFVPRESLLPPPTMHWSIWSMRLESGQPRTGFMTCDPIQSSTVSLHLSDPQRKRTWTNNLIICLDIFSTSSNEIYGSVFPHGLTAHLLQTTNYWNKREVNHWNINGFHMKQMSDGFVV